MRYLTNVPLILKAMKIAERAHAGQTRKVSGSPYFHHPIAVAFILVSYKQSKYLTELIIAAILHDTLEDTNLTFAKIAKLFGPLVASLVFELTNNEEEIKKLGKKEYQKRKFLSMTSYGLTLKLADRQHNMTEHPTQKMKDDTLELMDALLTHRSTLTKPQRAMIYEIQKLCRA